VSQGSGSGVAGSPDRRQGTDPIDRLVTRTGRRLALFMLVLVTALLVVVGVTTGLVATRLMDQNVERALEAAVASSLRASEESDEGSAPSSTDTFVLLLDQDGRAVRVASGAALREMPDRAAIAAAAASGRDLRDGTYGGVHARLLTLPATIPGHDDQRTLVGFAQAGYRLELHEEQEQQVWWTIAIVSALGIVGAGVITLLVTRRALGPVRAAFATERRFVAAASHELRTPVAIVRASAEILQREELIADEGRPLVSDIVAEADRMGLLVADLLSLASAEAGAIRVELRPVELVGWLGGLARRAESMAAGAGLSVVTELPAGRTVVVEADEDRLSQLILILVDNAVQHSPPGGAITLGVGAGGGKATIAVRDQGPGIAAADRERIFEPFARLPGKRRSRSGSGLGLAIARQLASRHGGELWVDDAPGGGARFTVRLPLAPAGTVAPLHA
jgi:two-component system, OmpR family, sensor histidine kinase CiaH